MFRGAATVSFVPDASQKVWRMRIIVPCKKRERDYTRHPSIFGRNLPPVRGVHGFTGVAVIKHAVNAAFFFINLSPSTHNGAALITND